MASKSKLSTSVEDSKLEEIEDRADNRNTSQYEVTRNLIDKGLHQRRNLTIAALSAVGGYSLFLAVGFLMLNNHLVAGLLAGVALSTLCPGAVLELDRRDLV